MVMQMTSGRFKSEINPAARMFYEVGSLKVLLSRPKDAPMEHFVSSWSGIQPIDLDSGLVCSPEAREK